jgi:hypothetical protein
MQQMLSHMMITVHDIQKILNNLKVTEFHDSLYSENYLYVYWLLEVK